MDRREFLRKSVMGGIGAAALFDLGCSGTSGMTGPSEASISAMGFGDSITADPNSYLHDLETMLKNRYSSVKIFNAGVPATKSAEGAERIDGVLKMYNPNVTYILYGTNDWNLYKDAFRAADGVLTPECRTADNLKRIVEEVKKYKSLPVLATIPPVPSGYGSRNEWVKLTNEGIRQLALKERIPLADVHEAFVGYGNMDLLLEDHVHQNEAGRRLIAEAFYNAA